MHETEMQELIEAIPTKWRNKILSDSQKFDFHKAPRYLIKRKPKYDYKNLTIRTLYHLFNKPKKDLEPKFKYWSLTYKKSMTGMTDEEWENLFLKLHKRKTNNRASEILFKAIHFLTPINASIHAKNRRRDSKCPLCLKPDETIAHMMYICEKAQPIILFTLDILDQLYPEYYPQENSLKFFFFGYSAQAGDREFGNIILETLITEIYFNRMQAYHNKTPLTVQTILKQYESKIKNLLYQEYEIIKSQNTLSKHRKEIRNIFNEKGYLNLVANTQHYLNF